MLKFISKLIGGNKSEKDVKQLEPIVARINQYFQQYQSLSNDALRNKTQEFKQRIKEHIRDIDDVIEGKKQAAEALPDADIQSRDAIYNEVDTLKKDRDKKIEEALEDILPEAPSNGPDFFRIMNEYLSTYSLIPQHYNLIFFIST